MNTAFALQDEHALSDLTVYLSRVKLIDDTAVRIIADNGVLAIYAAVMYQRGLLDKNPTVLGLRTFAETSGASFDRVVAPTSLTERLAHLRNAELDDTTVLLPVADVRASWAGIAPPRGGWQRIGEVDGAALEIIAKDGAGEIAAAIPDGTGDQLVQKVRGEVWSRPIADDSAVPSGAAFAAASLGFLAGSEEIPVFRSGPWLRLSSKRGHVLARGRG